VPRGISARLPDVFPSQPQPYAVLAPICSINVRCVSRPHPTLTLSNHHCIPTISPSFPRGRRIFVTAHISLPLLIWPISQDSSPLTFPSFSSLPWRSMQKRRADHWHSTHLLSYSSVATPSNPYRMSSKNKHELSINLLTAESRNRSILSSRFCIRFPPPLLSAALSMQYVGRSDGRSTSLIPVI
jgi:hypothetical protein